VERGLACCPGFLVLELFGEAFVGAVGVDDVEQVTAQAFEGEVVEQGRLLEQGVSDSLCKGSVHLKGRRWTSWQMNNP